VELLADDAHAGVHQLVNGLFATRADWLATSSAEPRSTSRS
jgi:hypothetical protein